MFVSRITCTIFAATLALGLENSAHADVKIVSEVNVTGSLARAARQRTSPPDADDTGEAPQPPPIPKFPQTVTTYFKGKWARVEGKDGAVTLYDSAANKVYVLDTAQKTYYVLSSRQALEEAGTPMLEPPMGGTSGPMPSMGGRGMPSMHYDTKLKLDTEKSEDGKTEVTRSIAGKDAKKFLLTATVQMHPDEEGGFGGGDRFPGGGGGFPGGGGGFPGGGGGFPGGGHHRHGGGGGFPGGGTSTRRERKLPSIAVTGEYWFVDVTALPGGDKSPRLPLLTQTVALNPLLKSLDGQLGKKKLIPLASRISVTVDRLNGEAAEPTVTTMEVKSITDGALDDALFKTPSDYKKIDPPKANSHGLHFAGL